jgi:hypothetical protein
VLSGGVPGTGCGVTTGCSTVSDWAAGLACGRERRKNPVRAPVPPPCPVLPCAGFFDDALASLFLRGVKKSATSLVAASVRASATMMSPNT